MNKTYKYFFLLATLILISTSSWALSFKCIPFNEKGSTQIYRIMDVLEFSNNPTGYIELPDGTKINGVRLSKGKMQGQGKVYYQSYSFQAQKDHTRIRINHKAYTTKRGPNEKPSSISLTTKDNASPFYVTCEKLEDSDKFKKEQKSKSSKADNKRRIKKLLKKSKLTKEEKDYADNCNVVSIGKSQNVIKSFLGMPTEVKKGNSDDGDNDTWIYKDGTIIKFHWGEAKIVTPSSIHMAKCLRHILEKEEGKNIDQCIKETSFDKLAYDSIKSCYFKSCKSEKVKLADKECEETMNKILPNIKGSL